MNIDSTLSSGWAALGITQPKIENNPLSKNKIVPWSYHLLAVGSVVGTIITIAAYILKDSQLFSVAAGMTLLSLLGAYEVKRLALTKEEINQIHSYKNLIDTFIAKVKEFATEKLQLDSSISKLTSEKEGVTKLNQIANKQLLEVRGLNETAQTQIAQLQKDKEEFKKLNVELGNNVASIKLEHQKLETLKYDQEKDVEEFKREIKTLHEQMDTYWKSHEQTAELLEKYESLNNSLRSDIVIKEHQIQDLFKGSEQLTQDNEQLTKICESLQKEREKFEGDMKKREELDKHLAETGKKLEQKIAKLEELKKAKQEITGKENKVDEKFREKVLAEHFPEKAIEALKNFDDKTEFFDMGPWPEHPEKNEEQSHLDTLKKDNHEEIHETVPVLSRANSSNVVKLNKLSSEKLDHKITHDASKDNHSVHETTHEHFHIGDILPTAFHHSHHHKDKRNSKSSSSRSGE